MEAKDLIGALVNLGADADLIEDLDFAQDVLDSINRASYYGWIDPESESYDFEVAMKHLDLTKANNPKKIFWWVDGSRCEICYPEDWDYADN